MDELLKAYPELGKKVSSFSKNRTYLGNRETSRDLNDPLVATYRYLASALASLESGYVFIDERDSGN